MSGKEKALFLAYPILWTFSVVSFWCFGSASDALGFTLLHRDRRRLGRGGLESSVPQVASVSPNRVGDGLHALRLSHLSSRQHDRLFVRDAPEWIMLPVGLALSLAGLLLGRILRRFVSGKD